METDSPDPAAEAPAGRRTAGAFFGSIIFWLLLVLGQYFWSHRSALVPPDSWWSTPFSAAYGDTCGSFLLGSFLHALVLALVIHVGARLLGGRAPLWKSISVWFVLSAVFDLLAMPARSHTGLFWSVRAARWVVYAVVFKRLYRLSWGQTAGGWVLAGSMAGALWIGVTIFHAVHLLTGLPWETLLQPPPLQQINRPAGLHWRLRSMDGKSVSLDQIHGKFLFVNVWATWCIPCRLELPSLQRLYARYRDSPQIEFFFVSEESPAVVGEFLSRHNYGLPFYTTLARPIEFMSAGIPVSFIVSPAGRIIAMQEGSMRWDSESVFHTLDGFLESPDLNAAPTALPEPPPADSAAIERLYRQGAALSARNEYDQAEAVLAKALQLRGNNEDLESASALYELANAFARQSRWTAAETYSRQALLQAQQLLKADDPRLARYYNALACIVYAEGRLGEAEALQGKAVELAKSGVAPSERAEYLRNYAKDLRSLNRSKEADAFERRAAKLDKRPPSRL